MMNAYMTVGANDHATSCAFYDTVLPTIGWSSHESFDGWKSYSVGGRGEGLVFWVCRPFNGEPATSGNGTMVGFMAKSCEEVDRFYAAAMKAGGQDEGAPGPRPQYGEKWYAAYLRDPSGNKLAVVFNG